jgi:hypothetical protein
LHPLLGKGPSPRLDILPSRADKLAAGIDAAHVAY